MIDKDKIKALSARWLDQKAVEKLAKDERVLIEKELEQLLEIDQNKEGSSTTKQGGYKIVVTTKHSRKVDTELLQEIAMEYEIDYTTLQHLFKWKADLKMKDWKAASEEITDRLSGAITSKPSKPGFKIELIEE